jgi:hypothetical protein
MADTSAQVHETLASKRRTSVPIPFTGKTIDIPIAPESLAYDLAIVGIAAIGIIEAPVGIALIVGHAFIRRTGNKRAGDAVDEALESVA